MKGQIFLIASVIVIITLVLIKNSIDITSVLENKRSLESSLERLEFENAKRELIRTVDYSANFSTNISTGVEIFLKFSQNVFSQRTNDFQAIAVSTYYPRVVSGSMVTINFTVLNLLERNLDFLNLTFSSTNVSTTFRDVAQAAIVTTNSTFTTSNTVNYTLTVFYNTTQGNITENILIPVEIGKSKFVGFFDLILKSSRLTQRDKFTETIDLSA